MSPRRGEVAPPLPWERAVKKVTEIHAGGHDEDSTLLIKHVAILRNQLRGLDMHPEAVTALIRQALLHGLERRKGRPIREVVNDPVKPPLHPRWREGRKPTPLDQQVVPQGVAREREQGPGAMPPKTNMPGRRPRYDDGPRRLQVMWAADQVEGTLIEGVLLHDEPDDKLALIMVYAGGDKPIDDRFVVWKVRNRGGFIGSDRVGSSDTMPHAHVHYGAARREARRLDPDKKRPKIKMYKAPRKPRNSGLHNPDASE